MTRVGSRASITTYRYLRLAMVVLVLALAVALVFEWSRTATGCWQTSISAYYYTPAQGVFVGALVAIGVCLVALKGNTEWEDILLNIAGVLAPVVAFVPTPGKGGCRSVPVPTRNLSADIENNVVAYLAAGAVALIISAALVVRAEVTDSAAFDERQIVGLLVAVGLLVGGGWWFLTARESFEAHAHNTAALALFACIVAVVVLNARGFAAEQDARSRQEGRAPSGRTAVTNRYAVIAVLMVGSFLGMGAYAWLVGWDHAVLFIEGTLITLFAAFWLAQTRELWGQGLRTDAGSPAGLRT